MLSRQQISHITSLRIKKFRQEYREFIAEGEKLVLELLQVNYGVVSVYAASEWLVRHRGLLLSHDVKSFETSGQEMARISSLSSPSPVLAVVKIPDHREISSLQPADSNSLILLLDEIRDPGNLGTMIRIADWFGINTVFCSESSVDLYNPKVIQATMGSVARVRVMYTSLLHLLERNDGVLPVFGALLQGQNIYETDLKNRGLILIGNEARGISAELLPFITHRLLIPSRSACDHAESLNASVACAIVCSEFRRRG